MPRTNIPATSQSALYASQTSQAYLWLLTITSATDTYHFTSDAVPTTFNGQVYEVFPFTIIAPSNEQEQISVCTITIDNISPVCSISR